MLVRRTARPVLSPYMSLTPASIRPVVALTPGWPLVVTWTSLDGHARGGDVDVVGDGQPGQDRAGAVGLDPAAGVEVPAGAGGDLAGDGFEGGPGGDAGVGGVRVAAAAGGRRAAGRRRRGAGIGDAEPGGEGGDTGGAGQRGSGASLEGHGYCFPLSCHLCVVIPTLRDLRGGSQRR